MNRRSVISVAMAGAVLVAPAAGVAAGLGRRRSRRRSPIRRRRSSTTPSCTTSTSRQHEGLVDAQGQLSFDNTYYPVDFKWGTTTVRNAGIRSRGTGSRSGEKPGLRLDFDRYTSNQKFLGLKSLVFRNSTQDPSNMHEQLSMLLFKRLGLVAPREIYARLFVNNAYAGLYSIVESIDK